MKSKLAQRYVDDGMAVTSKPQLLLSLYERLLADVGRAIEALESGEIETSHDNLVHAQDIVHELNLALDTHSWDTGRDLRAIYDHVTALLVEANTTKRAEPVRVCVSLLEPLHDAWRQAVAITQSERAGAVSSGSDVAVEAAG